MYEEFRLKSAPINRSVSSEIPGDLVPQKSSGILNPPRKEFKGSSIPQIPGKAIQSSGKSKEKSPIFRPSSSRFLNREKVYMVFLSDGLLNRSPWLASHF